MSGIDTFFKFVDENTKDPKTSPFIRRLSDAVGIPSISDDSDAKYSKEELDRMGNWLKDRLKDVGVQDIRDVQQDYDPDNKRPPLVVGYFGRDPKLKTLIIYSHYDVQPADAQGWAAENPDVPDPFTLTLLPNDSPVKLVGRGSTDDKGPLTAWLNVFQGHKEPGTANAENPELPVLPVNIRFLFEGVEEVGGPGLEEWIEKESKKSDGFFSGVDFAVITDNYWLTTRNPALTYGVRGIATFSIVVTGAKNDLHSGIYGRMVHEPLVDLVKLLAALVDTHGAITVPGVQDLVDPLTDEERQQYSEIDYSVDDLVRDTGAHVELSQNPARLLIGRMRYPSLSLHGIDGGRQGTIIPRQVTGRFSLRLVNSQTPDKVAILVKDFLYDQFEKLGTRNLLQVNYNVGADPWVGRYDDVSFKAADAATQLVYNKKPDYTREGGTIPLARALEDALNYGNADKNKSVLLLPMGKSDDGAHSLSEKLEIENYVGGTKLFGAYLYKIAELARNEQESGVV